MASIPRYMNGIAMIIPIVSATGRALAPAHQLETGQAQGELRQQDVDRHPATSATPTGSHNGSRGASLSAAMNSRSPDPAAAEKPAAGPRTCSTQVPRSMTGINAMATSRP